MKKALIIGIDDYSFGPLNGCINDAHSMVKVLETHEDGSPNFSCKLITSTPEPRITDGFLREEVMNFFKYKSDSALLYFSGHGSENTLDGYLVSQTAVASDPGLAFSDVMKLANQSQIPEVVIVLDCCHSGHMANWNVNSEGSSIAFVREGISVLSSSRGKEYSIEKGGRGLFTSIICEALRGGAADIKGDVTLASIYAYVDQLLGPFDQRPLFKSHVSRMGVIRKCEPKIEKSVLRRLVTYFKSTDSLHQLDPSYEPTEIPKGHQNELIFADLQEMAGVGLVAPTGEKHMYFAAINNKACELTDVGKFYWRMIDRKKI